MTCVACRQASSGWLCTSCRQTLVMAPDQVRGGVLVRSAFVHEAAARLLVHRLKYEAVAGIADRLAVVLEPLLGAEASALVPIPRVVARRWKYGIDPAVALAAALARRVDLPVVHCLGAHFWVRRRAGTVAGPRATPSFGLRMPAPTGAVLIDDVVTTGTTLVAASRVTGCRMAVTVTASESRGSGEGPASARGTVPHPEFHVDHQATRFRASCGAHRVRPGVVVRCCRGVAVGGRTRSE